MDKQLKTEKFDIRMSEEEQALIKQAANLERTTPSSFIRQSAIEAAESIVHDQTRFVLTDKQWNVLMAIFDEPARVLPNLRDSFLQSDDWDEES